MEPPETHVDGLAGIEEGCGNSLELRSTVVFRRGLAARDPKKHQASTLQLGSRNPKTRTLFRYNTSWAVISSCSYVGRETPRVKRLQLVADGREKTKSGQGQ